MQRLRERLRNLAGRQDLTTVIACAFDHRTRMLPFIYADMRMVPAGVRAIGSAMVDSGFDKTRIVLQQWNRHFRPSQMRLDGRIPDIFMVSSMQIHGQACEALIRDACRIDPVHRPLIIAGGPKTIYEPWDVFSTDPLDPWAADVAVTGEEYVILSLLEVLLSIRSGDEPLRRTFLRARNSGILDDIPGLVYARTDREGAAEELVDTGIQRLLGDLDELPSPAYGYRILERPSRKATLESQALDASKVRRLSPIGSLVLTFGCKFNCSYCPIPAYNQRQFRTKSGTRVAAEMTALQREFGIRHFFGADDNFFNRKEHTLGIVEALANTRDPVTGKRHRFRWATEVTVHDTLKLREYMPLIRNAGVRALWLGVEDMTATLINKGQTVDKTSEAFNLMRENGILPMPMMMHYDTQPLISRGPKSEGLLNQARLLRKAGAVSLQVLMVTPATGSRDYVETYTSGMVYQSVAGKEVEEHMLGGNFVLASRHPHPWRKQLNILIAYLYFYNPLRMLYAAVFPKTKMHFADAWAQLMGMGGLIQTARRTAGWAIRLMRGNIVRTSEVPRSKLPMRSAEGAVASHALPGTPASPLVQVSVPTPESNEAGRSGQRRQESSES
jgi:radical SAM superfamily enzyme YgiQ (UPF0313 family)